MFFRIIAVTEDGTGHEHSWGDSYQVHAESYEAAEARVLGLEPATGTSPYARVVKAWRQVTTPCPGWEQIVPIPQES